MSITRMTPAGDRPITEGGARRIAANIDDWGPSTAGFARRIGVIYYNYCVSQREYGS